MKAENTSIRLQRLMKERGLKQRDILQKAQPYCEKYGVKLGRNDLSQYVTGKVEPGQQKLTILGQALNVSEVWLMGYDVPMEPKKSGILPLNEIATISNRIRKDEDVQTLLSIYYNELSHENQKRLIEIAKGLCGK